MLNRSRERHSQTKACTSCAKALSAILTTMPALVFGQQFIATEGLTVAASSPLVIRTEPLRYGSPDAKPVSIRTETLRYGASSDERLAIRTSPLRYGVAKSSVPTIRTETLRYGVASPSSRLTIRTEPLRYGVALDSVKMIRAEPLRYGVTASDRPTIRTETFRYGVAADSVPTIRTDTLRYGVPGGNTLTVKTAPLRYGVYEGESAERDISFKLVRVTPLGNNAIDPFDYRDVIRTINDVTRPDSGAPPTSDPMPDPEPTPETDPVPLTFSGVPVQFVFNASLNFLPSAAPQQWSVAEGPDETTRGDAAFGFWAGGFTTSGYEIQFQVGAGWSAPGLPSSILLADENIGFETRTISVELTRLSDSQKFRVEADVSAGSDGDISVSRATGFDCFTNSGSCP